MRRRKVTMQSANTASMETKLNICCPSSVWPKKVKVEGLDQPG